MNLHKYFIVFRSRFVHTTAFINSFGPVSTFYDLVSVFTINFISLYNDVDFLRFIISFYFVHTSIIPVINAVKFTTKPDLVIMDYYMPNKNGIEALQVILELDKTAKVIIVSGDPTIK